MKRTLVFVCVMLSGFLLFSAVAPVSSSIGNVCLSPEDGRCEYLVLSAVKSEYSDEWLEKYAASPVPFAIAYSSLLSPLLPFGNCIVSSENDGEVKVRNMESGKVITFIVKEGKIAALRIDD